MREPVIDVHPLGQGYVDFGVQRGPHERQGRVVVYRQGARARVIVTDRLGGGSDAERRHHVVEEPVVMIRPERTTSLGPKSAMNAQGTFQGDIDSLAGLRCGLGETHQR